MNRVYRLFIAIGLNLSLLLVSGMWLMGQSWVVIGWAPAGRGEQSIRIDREGWMWQLTSLRFLQPQHASATGIRCYSYASRSVSRATWDEALSDGDVTVPMPGVVLYGAKGGGNAQTRIVGIRHWLLFLTVIGCWIAWQIRTRRKRQAAAAVAGPIDPPAVGSDIEPNS